MRGDFIDVSHWNTVTDKFVAAQKAGTLGVIVKATDGLHTDPKYHDHMQWVKERKLLAGAYHFLRPGDGVAQADHFLAVVGDFTGMCLVLDWEVLKADKKTPAVGAAVAKAFIERIHEKTGGYPVLYSYYSYLVMVLAKEPLAPWNKCKLWIAGYVNEVKWPSHWWPRWWSWQFTGDGHGQGPHDVPGVGKKVDISTYNGDRLALKYSWPTTLVPLKK